MFFDDFPDVPLANWKKFAADYDSPLYTRALNRHEAGLPDWFFPLARGVLIAAPCHYNILNSIQRQLDPHGPVDLRDLDSQFVETNEGYWSNAPLTVREFVDAVPSPLWSIERSVNRDQWTDHDEFLAHRFGATPIFAEDRQLAMKMALHCHFVGPLPRTRWIKFPSNKHTLNRQMDHARARDSLAYLRTLTVHGSKQAHR